jgi:hypothetical protein
MLIEGTYHIAHASASAARIANPHPVPGWNSDASRKPGHRLINRTLDTPPFVGHASQLLNTTFTCNQPFVRTARNEPAR